MSVRHQVSRPLSSSYDAVHHWPGYTAFWTLLRRARLCPNCEAIFDSSFTYCPSCGAQHLFDTISLLQVLNREELRRNRYGETYSVGSAADSKTSFETDLARGDLITREALPLSFMINFEEASFGFFRRLWHRLCWWLSDPLIAARTRWQERRRRGELEKYLGVKNEPVPVPSASNEGVDGPGKEGGDAVDQGSV